MRKFHIKGVVFDQDGLMIDSERVVKDSWDAAGEILGYGKLGEDNIHNTLGYNLARRKTYFLEHYGEDFPFDRFREEYTRAFQEFTSESAIPAKSGLYELLDTLEKRNIPMAVATSSSREYAVRNMDRLGIAHFFKGVLTGDMVAEGKPSPEIYQKACALLGQKPGDCLALEDAPNGILSAHGAGMHVILVPDLCRDSSLVDDLLDGKMESLEEVAKWIQSQYPLPAKSV